MTGDAGQVGPPVDSLATGSISFCDRFVGERLQFRGRKLFIREGEPGHGRESLSERRIAIAFASDLRGDARGFGRKMQRGKLLCQGWGRVFDAEQFTPE